LQAYCITQSPKDALLCIFVICISPIEYRWIFHNETKCLGFVSPCIIIHSNKSTNQTHQSLRFIARQLNTTQRVSAILMHIIRSL
jgi:hypothetical protein